MIDDFLKDIEEAIMALKLAGADIPNYKILDDGAVYFDYGTEEKDLGLPGEESRG